MSIIYQPKKLVVPFHIIKEQIDQHQREDWEDPDRYVRLRTQALKYILARAKDLPDKQKLLREVTRVFHDDLINDPIIIEAVERELYRNREVEPAILAKTPQERGPVRGVDDSDESLASLEQQLKEETTEP